MRGRRARVVSLTAARISVGQFPAPAPSPADVPSRFLAPSWNAAIEFDTAIARLLWAWTPRGTSRAWTRALTRTLTSSVVMAPAESAM